MSSLACKEPASALWLFLQSLNGISWCLVKAHECVMEDFLLENPRKSERCADECMSTGKHTVMLGQNLNSAGTHCRDKTHFSFSCKSETTSSLQHRYMT